MKRGEVYVRRLKKNENESVIIISHNGFNETEEWQSVMVVPVSNESFEGEISPTMIEIKKGDGGLKEEGYVICHQIKTVGKDKLGKMLGELSEETVGKINDGIRAALQLI